MTTITDTLTRWAALWEQDETLRPKALRDFTPADHTLWQLTWGDYDSLTVPDRIAAALIRDSAVRWLLARNHGRSYVHIDSNAGDPLPPIVIRSVGCMNKPGDTLDDALYAACKAVLGEEKT